MWLGQERRGFAVYVEFSAICLGPPPATRVTRLSKTEFDSTTRHSSTMIGTIESGHSSSEWHVRFCTNGTHWPHKESRRATVSLKSDWAFRSGGLLILRLRSFPNHQLKLMMTSITSKNTNLSCLRMA